MIDLFEWSRWQVPDFFGRRKFCAMLAKTPKTVENNLLRSGLPRTHWVPSHSVLQSDNDNFPHRSVIDFAGDGFGSRNSNTLPTRSRSRASANRLSCLSLSSWAFGLDVNDVVYKGALVPLPTSPPRPFETPLVGARPPTLHIVPTLTYQGQLWL